jgi:hypothetical protein
VGALTAKTTGPLATVNAAVDRSRAGIAIGQKIAVLVDALTVKTMDLLATVNVVVARRAEVVVLLRRRGIGTVAGAVVAMV